MITLLKVQIEFIQDLGFVLLFQRVQGGGIQPKVMEITKMMKYKIRKLTPKECFRLMNYTDADFEKAAKVNSNSQLYKQAGNAIVKSCLMAIFSQLNLKGVKKWNDMSVEERQKLVEGEK